LKGFNEGVRRELYNTGIHVMTVLPGFTETDMVSNVGVIWRKMGFDIIPVERVAQRTLDGILLRESEITIGLMETLGGYLNQLSPEFGDIYWRVLAPENYEEVARTQFSE
jgi:short-subunit dehydrogenase